ncbi:MAG: YibE/F family protein [Clostridia bacterium]|nr:YibE/F family protein [Clostridia bacterium]
MLKKIALIIITFVLMINCYMGVIYATETGNTATDSNATQNQEAQKNTENPEGTEDGLVAKHSEVIEAKARVIEAGEVKKVTTGSVEDTVQDVKIEILDGEFEAKEYETSYILSYDIDGKILAYELKEGDKVTAQIAKDSDGTVTVTVQDVQRGTYIYIMFFVFLASVIIVGGKEGIKAVIGLLITILCIWFILIRGIFNGANPIWTSIGTSAVIIVLTFLVIGGISRKIITAAIGTLGGVVMSGVMAAIFSYLAKLSGACEDAIQLSISMKTVTFNFRDLIFAGIVVSALGACMDVGMSIASSLDEIKNKTKDITWQELFKSGMSIGKDVIGTMTNTLILAYVGGALKLILLFLACDMQLGEILNKETIAEEIISAIAGSMGVVYTVPITAFVYSFLNRKKTIYKTVSENKIEGKRSLKI